MVSNFAGFSDDPCPSAGLGLGLDRRFQGPPPPRIIYRRRQNRLNTGLDHGMPIIFPFYLPNRQSPSMKPAPIPLSPNATLSLPRRNGLLGLMSTIGAIVPNHLCPL